MRRRFLLAISIAAIVTMAPAVPALAHGDHDARPLARHLQAGPYTVSLWQVYPDVGQAMTPLLIVMFDGGPVPEDVEVSVTVDSAAVGVHPSLTTANGWETMEGLDEGDVVAVTISEGLQAWDLDPIVVPPPPTAMLPMKQMIAFSVFLAAGVAWWVISRTARAWRRPVPRPT